MRGFYRGLCNGLVSGAALRLAQLELLDNGPTHPFVWAPFQLVGVSRTLGTSELPRTVLSTAGGRAG
jgi:hypothetical protein